jgi:geranylgeranyl pyrophosphate synthase
MQRDAAALRLRLIESGAVRRTSESAQRLVMQAKTELGLVHAGPARNLLAALADAVVSRTY